MTAFENYFRSLKRVLGREDIYDIWPDFEPEYGEREFTWVTLRGLGEVLLLNCGRCEGPSDVRHPRCKACVESRSRLAKNVYKTVTGREKDRWSTVVLCRIHVF
ncbi:hypothetical protein CW709_04260 [Candidatus Bathyarchaeota archaeon]|nr:hypothetical protein [Candidatus Bathyarchaeota archaeon]PDM26140.1 MAG: hypothetical protein CP083_05365 [Candidatus Bathyarchaeota archaeon B24-2]RJS81942.1 MAG: hypothetical protein CW709_04260 [Candidatus Bathyarchaeota archaeon]RLG97593.1 MAG: hypothetical protein DRO28_03950 [Candidatus Bathyarchaeota archaeon]HDN62765.1 hypothetical protein [Candidatus Bathyarchaeota archaeon]